MVNILPLIYNSFQKNSTDYFEEMLPSLDNYLSFGTPNLKESREFQSMMFNIIQQVFSQVDAGEAEYVRACQLSESFLLNLSSIDEIIPKFIDLALNVLNNFDAIKTTSYKVQCIEIVVNCIYNNPIVALSYLDSRQALLSFFGLWKNNLGNFKRVHDKRLAILTICKLIWIDFRGIDRMELLACLVSLFDGYKEALEERERMDAMYNGGESEDDDEYDEMESDNEDSDFEDDVQDDDDEYLKYLKESAANRANEDDEEDDDDEDEWGVSGLEEDPYFVTILDKIDPHIVFQDTLGKLTVEDQNMFAGSLTEAQRAVLDNVILAAVAGRQKATSN